MTSAPDPQDGLLAQILSRAENGGADQEHLDDETLALFAAGGIEGAVRDAVVAHLSQCGICRQTASTLISSETASSSVADLLSQAGSGDAETALRRGRLMLALGRITDAQNDLRRATQLAPENAQAHFALADVYLQQADPDFAQAEAALRRGLMIDKDNSAAKARLAGVLEQLDRGGEALALWNELLRDKLSDAQRSQAEAASQRLRRK